MTDEPDTSRQGAVAVLTRIIDGCAVDNPIYRLEIERRGREALVALGVTRDEINAA